MNTFAKVYLGFNAVMYLILGAWCALAPEFTAQSVGLSYIGMKGIAEYVAVYGGLEFGIGVFYLLSLFQPKLREGVILFSLCLYMGLSMFRTGSLIRFGSEIENGWYFYFTEILLFIGALWLTIKKRKPSVR